MFKKRVYILPLILIFLAALPQMYCYAAPQVTVNRCYVNQDRVEIKQVVTVGFRLTWTKTGSPLSSGIVTVNGERYGVLDDGWIYFEDTSHKVGKKKWSIDSVEYIGAEQTFTVKQDDPTCIFDKIHVNLWADKERIGVGENPVFIVDAFYMYDYDTFIGRVKINSTEGDVWLDLIEPEIVASKHIVNITSHKVGKSAFKVKEVEDNLYNVKAVESQAAVVIWDEVEITLWQTKKRFGVGQEPEIHIYAQYEYDGSKFTGTLNFNNSLVQNEIGQYGFTVESIEDNMWEVNKFKSGVVKIIFDKVEIHLYTPDDRINVGETAEIYYNAKYQYDGFEYTGDLYFDQSLVKDNVGSRIFTVERARDSLYEVDAFESDSVEIVWDQVKVDLSVDDTRVNVGETVEVQVSAYYEFDHEEVPLESVQLNAYEYTNDKDGDFKFQVMAASGEKYGITAYTTDELKVIWDQIEFYVQSPRDRVILGSDTDPMVNAIYAYDNKPFKGTYQLNQPFNVQSGSYRYWVSSFEDEGYGLTKYTTTEGDYYFDSVSVTKKVEPLMPGTVSLTCTLFYDSDGAPVQNALIETNGKPHIYKGNGVYKLTLRSIFPYINLPTSVNVGGMYTTYLTSNSLLIGNTVILAVVLGAASFGLNRVVRADAIKARKEEKELALQELKDRIIMEMERLGGVISLNELVSVEGISPKQRNLVIDNAIKEGLLNGRRLKKEDKFVYDGVEKKLVKDKLLGIDGPFKSLEDVNQYFNAEEEEPYEEPEKTVTDEELDSRLGFLDADTNTVDNE